jgi:hypothetical protein
MPGFQEMEEIQRRVLDHPDYPQLRADVEAAYQDMQTAHSRFMAAQNAVNELWRREYATYIEERDQ